MFGSKEHNCAVHGHRFEPRYDEVEMGSLSSMEVSGVRDADDLRRLMIRHVYVHDICVRCGRVVKREGGE